MLRNTPSPFMLLAICTRSMPATITALALTFRPVPRLPMTPRLSPPALLWKLVPKRTYIASYVSRNCGDIRAALATLTRLHTSRLRSTILVFWLSVSIKYSVFALQCLIHFLGYTQTLRPGVKASFGLALDTQRLNDTSL